MDITRLVAEIEEEVARRRASGELPRAFERELDHAFAELAPVDAIGADFDSIVTKIERSATIDIRPSTVSAYPGASQVKQVITKATAFSLRHVASQASGLFQAMARALRLLADRVDELEARTGPKESGSAPDCDLVVAADTSYWGEFVVAQISGQSDHPGRVLQAEAADGRLVRRLVDAGIDAYGVVASEEAALIASDLVPDIRAVQPVEHLRTLPPDSLGAVVLSGFIESLDVGSLVELVELVASRLVAGGTLIVISTHPAAWLKSGPPVAVDLAPGRPLHPETWQLLLGRAGFNVALVELGPVPELAIVPGDEGDERGPTSAAVCNENFARLAEAMFVPADFAVRARLSL